MKVLLVKTNGSHEIINDFGKDKSNLEHLYELIGCSCVTCVTRLINGKEFDIWLDDEGLLKKEKSLSGLLKHNEAKEVLVGNLVIANVNAYGEMKGLTKKDIQLIEERLYKNELIFPNDETITRVTSEVVGYEHYGEFIVERKGEMLIYEL